MQNCVALLKSGHQNSLVDNCRFRSFHRFDVAAFGHHNKQGKVDDTEMNDVPKILEQIFGVFNKLQRHISDRLLGSP